MRALKIRLSYDGVVPFNSYSRRIMMTAMLEKMVQPKRKFKCQSGGSGFSADLRGVSGRSVVDSFMAVPYGV